MQRKSLALCVSSLVFLIFSSSALAYDGIGYYCESYKTDAHQDNWSLKNCQKVIYDVNGFPIGVEDEKLDVQLDMCLYNGPQSCETYIKDKKKYPTYYGYFPWAGAAMPEGLDFWRIYVLNHKKLAEGTKIGSITICIHNTEYGLQNCRKL